MSGFLYPNTQRVETQGEQHSVQHHHHYASAALLGELLSGQQLVVGSYFLALRSHKYFFDQTRGSQKVLFSLVFSSRALATSGVSLSLSPAPCLYVAGQYYFQTNADTGARWLRV